MKKIFFTGLFCIIFSSGAQVQAQNTFPATGPVGIGTSSPSTNLVVDPKGPGSIRLGDNNASSGGYTSLNMEISAAQNGYSTIQSIKSAGTEWGVLSLNPFGGNVGIGTSSPSTKLVVDPKGPGSIRLGNDNASSGGYTSLNMEISAAQNGYSTIQSIKSAGTEWGVLSLNRSGGNVGIGTDDTKGYKLGVNGSAIATSMTVKLNANWPDFVFAETYGLRSLSEVENYIKVNSHLPEVPSAIQVAKDGINLGEMDATLLKKIEELTLYLIEQNKQLQEVKKVNEALQKEVQTLKK